MKIHSHANILLSNDRCVDLSHSMFMIACIVLSWKIKLRVLLIRNMLVKITIGVVSIA